MLAYSGYSSGCLPSRLGFFCITMFASNGREGYGGGRSGSRGGGGGGKGGFTGIAGEVRERARFHGVVVSRAFVAPFDGHEGLGERREWWRGGAEGQAGRRIP